MDERAMPIDESGTRLVHSNELNALTLPAHLGDHALQRAHRGQLPDMRVTEVDDHRAGPIPQIDPASGNAAEQTGSEVGKP